MTVRLRFLLLSLLFTTLPLSAEVKHLSPVPDYYVAQFAGSIGLLSFGAGWQLRYPGTESELLLGYAPAAVTGESIVAAAIKWRYVFAEMRVEGGQVRPYFGMGLNYYFGKKYDTGSNYPSGYYPYSQWHLMPHIGVRLTPLNTLTQKGALYLEAGVLDTYLIHYYNNDDYLGLDDVISVSVGINYPVD